LCQSARAAEPRVEAALNNILALQRPGQTGLATFWDGNKYIQCRSLTEHSVRCEAAGALMQPSLSYVLTPQRIARLKELGWSLDPSFGNYVQVFSGGMPVSEIAGKILQALRDGCDIDAANLEILSDWIKSVPCPQRNGPGQNLAGMINDSAAMARTSIRTCSYAAATGAEPAAVIASAADLIRDYGTRVTGEIQRLRINLERKIFFVVETGGGYVQCGPQTSPPAIYCEAQSGESWPVLKRILTPDRIARLHAAGFADPGRAPNYWKVYAADRFSDAAISAELLTILYEVYGYNGAPKLSFATEKGRS
jgi:hypothetical protein